MVSRAYTVAFQGVDARIVEVQCAVTAGLPGFSIVGLADKAVSEARDRVRTALSALAIALPSKRITVNLSPPTCLRKAAISTCPSRWRCSRPLISCRMTSHKMWWPWESFRSTGR